MLKTITYSEYLELLTEMGKDIEDGHQYVIVGDKDGKPRMVIGLGPSHFSDPDPDPLDEIDIREFAG